MTSEAAESLTCPLDHTFDHHSIEYRESVPQIFSKIVAESPVIRSDKHGGFAMFSRYADISQIARDNETFSNDNDVDGVRNGGKGAYLPSAPVRMGFLEMDPPQHGEGRRIFTKWFTPGAVDRYEGRLREIVIEELDRVGAHGSFDAVLDLANRITAVATLEFMGLPTDGWQLFAEPLHMQAYVTPASPEFPEMLEKIGVARAHMMEIVADRRARPAEDYVSHLVGSAMDGEPINDTDAADNLWTTIAGGFDTSSGSMVFAMIHLTEDRALRARLAAEPDLIPAAVEEFLRFGSPVNVMARTVVKPVEVGGAKLAAGDRILLCYQAANFDPDRFPSPYVFRLDRGRNRHLAFGEGIHRCPGSRLATLEVRVFLEELLRRLPHFATFKDRATPFPSVGVMNGFVSVPATADETQGR